jgi:hypothetical protein
MRYCSFQVADKVAGIHAKKHVKETRIYNGFTCGIINLSDTHNEVDKGRSNVIFPLVVLARQVHVQKFLVHIN